MLVGRAVLAGQGRVLALGAAADRLGRRGGAEVLDLDGHYLAPGFVDLHTHGAVGVDFVRASREELERSLRHYLAHGVTTLLLSLYPSPPAASLRVLDRLAGYLDRGAGRGMVAGFHLEGPYLSPKRPGALPVRAFRAYSGAELSALISAARGYLRTMTVAPEREGGMRLIRALLRRGIVPAFGHSDADYALARGAVRAGTRYVTHLFNAMRGLHHRDPGAVTALLEDPRVTVEVIADGHHIDLPVLRLIHALKPRDRVVLVSDSVAACGLPPGRHLFAGKTVELHEGRVTLADGTLAGSALTLDRAVALHVEKLGLPPAEAVLLATRNPARLLGLGRRRGEIAVGRRADLVLLDRKLRVRATWLAGELAWP